MLHGLPTFSTSSVELTFDVTWTKTRSAGFCLSRQIGKCHTKPLAKAHRGGPHQTIKSGLGLLGDTTSKSRLFARLSAT